MSKPKSYSAPKSEKLTARRKHYDRTQVGDLYWFDEIESVANIEA